jgi:hypothetical protein
MYYTRVRGPRPLMARVRWIIRYQAIKVLLGSNLVEENTIMPKLIKYLFVMVFIQAIVSCSKPAIRYTLISSTASNPVLDKVEYLRSISGIIADDSGQPIIGGIVSLSDISKKSLQKVTGLDGRFNFNDLKPGVYSIAIDASGYKKIKKRNLILESSGSLFLEIVLRPSPTDRFSYSYHWDTPMVDLRTTTTGIKVWKSDNGLIHVRTD